MFIPQNHPKSQQRVRTCTMIEKSVFRASLALSMLEIELYQISLPYDRGRSGYEIMIGQMAIGIALFGFNDLGCSVNPTFLFRNRFSLQLSPHCTKMSKKSMWEVKKNSRFLSSEHANLPSCGCKAHETMVAKCELVL